MKIKTALKENIIYRISYPIGNEDRGRTIFYHWYDTDDLAILQLNQLLPVHRQVYSAKYFQAFCKEVVNNLYHYGRYNTMKSYLLWIDKDFYVSENLEAINSQSDVVIAIKHESDYRLDIIDYSPNR